MKLVCNKILKIHVVAQKRQSGTFSKIATMALLSYSIGFPNFVDKQLLSKPY